MGEQQITVLLLVDAGLSPQSASLEEAAVARAGAARIVRLLDALTPCFRCLEDYQGEDAFEEDRLALHTARQVLLDLNR
jgi:hypothetical protein